MMGPLHRTRFDHIGIPTREEKAGAVWLEDDRVWLTSPRAHPLNVEWVRHAHDSRMDPRLQARFHLAYRVDDVRRAIEGYEVIHPPFEIGDGFATVAFVEIEGVTIELMQYRNPDEEGWI